MRSVERRAVWPRSWHRAFLLAVSKTDNAWRGTSTLVCLRRRGAGADAGSGTQWRQVHAPVALPDDSKGAETCLLVRSTGIAPGGAVGSVAGSFCRIPFGAKKDYKIHMFLS